MPYNLLLLPLLGGFLFIHIAHYFRFNAQRLDGYRLLIQSALFGTALEAIARVFIFFLSKLPFSSELARIWALFSPFPNSGTSALALVLGPLAAWSVNRLIDIKTAKNTEIQKHGNAILRLLHQAETRGRLLSVTLNSRKWYVGYVAESPNLDPNELYFRLLPIISGYRDKDTLETVRTVFYEDVLQDSPIDTNDFVITLPLKDIMMASLFDEKVYEQYFAEAEPEPSDVS